MSVVKVIELIAESEQSWEAAAQAAVEHAGRTIRNIRSVYVEDFQAKVENNNITLFRVTAKITFVIDDAKAGD
ncbi:MAG: dodecin family protein [Chloroflexota bacterium]